MTARKGVDELDPQLTFENFVVGPANRLAAAAARRATESPGTAYNPLFVYAAAGLGKSHLLHAIAHLSHDLHPGRVALYQTSDGYLEELERAIGRGAQESFRDRYTGVGLLLFDDVQFIAGQTQAQEILLKTLDTLTGRGAQVVLASDRPPAEIDGLDGSLLSRFSGGLIVDIGQPDYETRVAILRRKASVLGADLIEGVAEAVSRFPFKNVRDLQGALNRVLAEQELEGRPVTLEDVPQLMSELKKETPELPGGPQSSVSDSVTDAAPAELPELEDDAEWRRRIYQAADAAKAEHVFAAKIVRLLDMSEPPEDWEATLSQFEEQLQRIREIRIEMSELGDPWPQATATLLTNPDRLEEAEALLVSARELKRPFSTLPEGPGLRGLGGRFPALAVKAAEQLIRGVPSTYNPLFVYSASPHQGQALLEATGRTYLESNPDGRVGMISVPEFADEFIRAIQDGVAGAWRERWWGVDLLLLHEVQELSSTERAQEEVFHLFEALYRGGGRIVLAADRSPSSIEGVDERLGSRFEGGLVVDLGPVPPTIGVTEKQAPTDAEPQSEWSQGASEQEDVETGESATESRLSEPASVPDDPMEVVGDDDLAAVRELAGVVRGRPAVSPEALLEDGAATVGPSNASGSKPWIRSPEKVIWDWPDIEELIADDRFPPSGGSDGD